MSKNVPEHIPVMISCRQRSYRQILKLFMNLGKLFMHELASVLPKYVLYKVWSLI